MKLVTILGTNFRFNHEVQYFLNFFTQNKGRVGYLINLIFHSIYSLKPLTFNGT